MKTKYQNNLNAPLSFQRGFFTVGLGLGLTALYGLIASAVVANHELSEKDDQVVVQQVESQIQSSTTELQLIAAGFDSEGLYD